MKYIITLLSLLTLIGFTFGISLRAPYQYNVSITERRDGDTFEGYIWNELIAIRIANIDCMEIWSKRWDLLKVLFNKYLITDVSVRTYGRSYDRIVADVFIGWTNLGDLLVNNNICKRDVYKF